MSLMDLLEKRRSVRKYTSEDIKEEDLEKIIQSAFLVPSGHGAYPCEVIVIKNKDTLNALAKSRVGAAKMLEGAKAAVVVIGNNDKSTTCIEDASIMMENMHLMCEELGLGSCWIQLRLREAENKEDSQDYVRDVLGIPANYLVEAVLSIGYPEVHPEGKKKENIDLSKIHKERF